MAGVLQHRGPDSSGIWVDGGARVGFAHQRLAIIDLSIAGNQPMESHSGRYVIIYNGEIYNHLSIRDDPAFAGTRWVGQSDTETFLAAIESWGPRRAIERSVGMFAFALWDKQEKVLTLARDRAGEKPLYYGRPRGKNGPFIFGSELKALTGHPAFDADVDRDALALLVRYGYIPAPYSIYRQVKKLPPGTLLTLRDGDAEPVIEQYWSGSAMAETWAATPLEISETDAINELHQMLRKVIDGQMMADVPVGLFLSGGIDSTLIAAMMQEERGAPVKTFTVGFREKHYNEADHAAQIAHHLGTDHTELYIGPEDALKSLPTLPIMYDEPFADSSQIPTYLVSALARTQVKVVLSGDAGDELFGGYNRYVFTDHLWGKLSRLPRGLRRMAGRAITRVSPSAWTKLGNAAGGFLPKVAQVDRLGEKLHKSSALLDSENIAELYAGMQSLWPNPAEIVIGASESLSHEAGAMPRLNPIERMMALDLVGYLPDDILVKLDRAAMAASLETRLPFLDHRLMEFAWRLPFRFKLRGGEGKWILRQLLDEFVPRHLMERPKTGFTAPIGEWLRGPLRDWAEALLDLRRLQEQGYFRPEFVRSLWAAHLTGKVDLELRLWPILMFQAWLGSQSAIARA